MQCPTACSFSSCTAVTAVPLPRCTAALQVLPQLGDVPPEARLNLVIHHLRHGEVGEAFNLIKDMEPTTPQEYILKVWGKCERKRKRKKGCLGAMAVTIWSSVPSSHCLPVMYYTMSYQ